MSKDIEVSCPKCGQMLSIEAQYAGRKGKCPYCGEHFIIPESEVELKPAASFMEVSQSSQTIRENPKDYVYVMTTPEEYRNFAWRRWTARRDASPHRTAVERRPYQADFAKCGGGGREVEAPPRWRLSQLVRRQDGGFPS